MCVHTHLQAVFQACKHASELQAFQPRLHQTTGTSARSHSTLVLLPKTATGTHVAERRTGATPRAGLIRPSLAPTALHSVPISPVLRRPGCCSEPALHCLRCENVVLASAECGPNACEEIEQVSCDETGELAECSALAVDDEGHKQQGEGQVLRIEVHNEEANLTRWVVLGECVGVCEGKGGEERVAVQKDTCKRL